MARLTAKARDNIPKKDFAVPATNGYPVDTKARAKAALGLVGMHGTSQQKAAVRSKVAAKYPGIEQSKGPQAKKTGGKGNGKPETTTQRLSRTLDDRLDEKQSRRPT